MPTTRQLTLIKQDCYIHPKHLQKGYGIGVAGAPPPYLVLGNFCMPTTRQLTLIKQDCYIHPKHLQKRFGYFLLGIAVLVLW